MRDGHNPEHDVNATPYIRSLLMIPVILNGYVEGSLSPRLLCPACSAFCHVTLVH